MPNSSYRCLIDALFNGRLKKASISMPGYDRRCPVAPLILSQTLALQESVRLTPRSVPVWRSVELRPSAAPDTDDLSRVVSASSSLPPPPVSSVTSRREDGRAPPYCSGWSTGAHVTLQLEESHKTSHSPTAGQHSASQGP